MVKSRPLKEGLSWREYTLDTEELEPRQPSLSEYTPPNEDDVQFRFWLYLAIAVILTIIIVPFLVTAVVPAAVSLSKYPVAAEATVEQPDSRTIIVTYLGGPGAGSVVGIRATVTTADGWMKTDEISSESTTKPLMIGTSLKFEGDFAGRDHVIATGSVADGRQIVLLDTHI